MSEQVSTRKATVVETDLCVQGHDCNRWAVIVGISKYKHAALNLQYADRDAEKLYQLLLTPQGGHFQKEYVCKLTNKEATKGNITRALRSFLKKPAREDVVIIYFACHGSPDPDRPGNVYLLTHDSDPQDVAGSALPMGDIDRALKDTLLSEKVIIMADTCHSAAIGGGIRSRAVTESTRLVNRYLREISQARHGTALLTSAEANEVSFEDKKWGGGHGVFTYYLLRGLKGEADANNNGFVAVGELFEYVRENVKKATNHRQHPSIGTNPFDRNMPLAIAFPSTEENQTEGSSATNGLMSNLPGGALPTWSGERGRPTFKKRYVAISLVALLLGGVGLLAGVKRGWFGTAEPSNPSGDAAVEVDDSEQVLQEAKELEEETITQMQQMLDTKQLTDEGLAEVILTWEAAQTLLQGIDVQSAGDGEATELLQIYESHWHYATGLKKGLEAGKRSSSVDQNTLSEEWDAIIALRKEAIAHLKNVRSQEETLFKDAQQIRIPKYEKHISINEEYRLVARYQYASRQGDVAEKAREKADSTEIQSAADWYEVAGLWGNAVKQMRKVMPEDRGHEEAHQKIDDYTENQEYARKRGDLLAEARS